MRKLLNVHAVFVVMILLCASPALGDSCPYCGRTYGASDPRYPEYTRRIRAEHEATCPARNRPGGQTSPTGNDAQLQMVQAMAPLLQQAIHDMFRTDPAEEARRRQAMLEAAERARQEEERRRAEEERRRQEMFDRLSSQLMLSDLSELAPMGFDGDRSSLVPMGMGSSPPLEPMFGDSNSTDDGLRPQGTSFFGLGGGTGSQLPSEPSNDPMVVDLRNCRRAAFLAQAAEKASPEDAERLQDEAVRGAQGDTSFVADPPAGAVPVVSEAGLIDFHKKSIAYAEAHDFRMRQTQLFNQAQARWELVDRAVRIKKEALERELAEKVDTATLEEEHRLMAELFAVYKAEDEAWVKARAEQDAARSREASDRAVLLVTLQTVTAPAPPTYVEILRKELEALKPTLAEYFQHERCRVAARQMAEEWDSDIQAKYDMVVDPGQEERLSALTERVRKLLPYGNEPLEVKIVGDFRGPDAGTYDGLDGTVVTSGRTIYFGREYLAHNPTDDELLFVIGHETAHAQRDHAYLYSIYWKPEAEELNDLRTGGKIELPEDRVRLYMDIRMHRLTYEQETQADRLGAAMAIGAGANPEGIRDAFNWMAAREDMARRLPEWARTHPRSRDRFQALRNIWGSVIGELR